MDTEEAPLVCSAVPLTEEQVDESTEEDSLAKESCHDSGIDIRDTSIPPIVPVQTNKKVTLLTCRIKCGIDRLLLQYSDADIVLSKDWVPPITIAPTQISSVETDSPARKKNSSVSFSLDSSSEADPATTQLPNNVADVKKETDKAAESRKNKASQQNKVL